MGALFGVMAFAAGGAPWDKAVQGINGWFSNGWADLAGLAIVLLGIGRFMFSGGHNKMEAIIELIIGVVMVAYHASLVSIF